ncbi:SHOCT domain-containing protein [uncultured Methanobrevibacter sp.]|uniref:SHOCT domain-containing protein n=1 Tax=uncultured Methanobrevibacter sp. TaxID=253161 RepID=UPI00320A9F8C
MKQIYNLIDMGLFGNKKTDEEIIEETLSEFNIFEGVLCEVTFPEKQLKLISHDGITKGAATLAFGLVGWAATSGIKQDEDNRKLKTIVQVVKKGIVFKNSTKDSKDLRIPYENIVKVEKRKDAPRSSFFIILLENQVIEVWVSCSFNLTYTNIVSNHFVNVLEGRVCGAQYEEAGWGLEHGTVEPQETKQESGDLMDELERLGDMYKEGLLTDDEFKLAKKKLLEGD